MKYSIYVFLSILLVFTSALPVEAAQTSQSKFSCLNVTQIPQVECEALVAVYNATNGPGWTNNFGWLASTSPSDWYGVTVVSGHVTELILNENQLGGNLPSELGNLPYLNLLNLNWNDITGSIPPQLGNLSNLTGLILSINHFSGNIPAELGNLSKLEDLTLFSNQLSGPIPPQLGNLAQLKNLSLFDNELTGSIPPDLKFLSSLEFLDLGYNNLSGTIPVELGNLSTLISLILDHNQLSGTIPAEIGFLSNLGYLYLSKNQLIGNIPSTIFGLSNLSILYLRDNKLSGDLSSGIGSLASLLYLDLSNNQFTGDIPSEIGNLTSLNYLALSNNQLSGGIPSELSSLTSLTSLYLDNNQITGTIPIFLENFIDLQTLFLSSNRLSGSIPDVLGTLINLQVLHLEDNLLDGDIPANFIQLQSLLDPGQFGGRDGLDLDYNSLNIPAGYPDPADPLQVFLSQKDPDWQLYQGFSQVVGVSGGEITSLDGRTDFLIPPGALDGDVTFKYMPHAAPYNGSIWLSFAHNSFGLTAQDSGGNPVIDFNIPLTVTLTYTDSDFIGLPEASLGLYFWNEATEEWSDAVSTCLDGVYTRDPLANQFSLPLCHLTEFGVFGQPLRIFLPTVRR